MTPVDTATAPATFSGWATVEIMGHNQVSGYVEAVAFGATVMFRVSIPAMEPTEQITDRPLSVNYQRIHEGSKIRVSREAFETLIGSASIYRMTRVSEETALARHGQKVEILELAEEPKAIAGPTAAAKDRCEVCGSFVAENGECPDCEEEDDVDPS